MLIRSDIAHDIERLSGKMNSATLDMQQTVLRSTVLIEQSRALLVRADEILAADAPHFGPWAQPAS